MTKSIDAQQAEQMAAIKKVLRPAFLEERWSDVLQICETWLDKRDQLRPIDVQTFIWHKNEAIARMK